MKCETCDREAERGIFCQSCDVIQTAVSRIYANWNPSEIGELIQVLESGPIDQIIAKAGENSAWRLKSLLISFSKGATIAGDAPEVSKAGLIAILRNDVSASKYDVSELGRMLASISAQKRA